MFRRRPFIPILALLVASLGPAGAPAEGDLVGLDGAPIDPFQGDLAARVFVFTRTDCPISNRYAPELRRLYEKFVSRDVGFWLVYPDPNEPVDKIREHLADYDHPMPPLRDPRHSLVRETGATVTPEVVVYSSEGRIVYRGRIDNRYVDFGKTRAAATIHDLEDALEATLGGRAVEVSTTRAVGCFIPALR